MVTSSYISWKLVSRDEVSDGVISEYESPIQNSNQKYHLSVLVTPQGEHHRYSVI